MSQPSPMIKVVFTGPNHAFDVKVDVGFSSSLPSGNIDRASRLLQLDREFSSTLNVSIKWTRSSSTSSPSPYRAELIAGQTTQGLDEASQQACSAVDKPTGSAPGASTITKALDCRWKKLPLLLEQDSVPEEVQKAIGLPPDRPLAVFQSVADFQVFSSNGSHTDGFTIMVFTYYTTSSAKLDPSVVFPKESGAEGWPITLATASAQDVTSVRFGTLPSAVIAGRDAQTLRLIQSVPPDTKPGQYKLTVTQKGQAVSLPVYLYVAGIEILDPNPGLLTATGGVAFNAASLAGGAASLPRRKAVAADGVTPVVLRIPSDQPMSVQVLGEKAGAIESLLDPPGSSAFGTPVADPQVGSAVYMLYTPPKDLAQKPAPGEFDLVATDDLDAPGPNDPGTQSVSLRVNVVPASGGGSAVSNEDAVRKHRALTLVRPPLVLIHGIWSSREVWRISTSASPAFDLNIQRLTGARWVGTADYEVYHSRSFDPRRAKIEGIEALKSEIQLTLSHYREAGIAATQVDVVGHSMGGIMTRVFSQRTAEYLRKNNFMKGDVHKLVTLDTPHSGSLFVLYLWNNRDRTIVSYPGEDIRIDDLTIRFTREAERITVGKVFATAGMPIDEGAVENFRPCSEAIKAIDASLIPTHTVSGIRPDHVSTNLLAKVLFNAASGSQRILRSVDEVIGHGEHDVIVEAESMRGGLPNAAIGQDPLSRPSHDQPDVIHSFVTNRVDPLEVSVVGNPATQKVVGEILRSPVDEGNVFRKLPAPRDVRFAPWNATSVTGPCDAADSNYIRKSQADAPQAPRRSAAFPRASTDPYLEIVSPAIGAEFAPGDTITVTAVPRNGLQPQDVFFYGMPNSPVQTGDLQAIVRIPENFAGRSRIEVYASDGKGNAYRGIVEVYVRPARPPAALSVSPGALRFTYATQTAQLSVTGQYADGTTVSLRGYRDLRFTASNPEIAAVSTSGKVQALRAGSASIQVALGGLSAVVPVEVSISNATPVFDPVSAIQLAAGQTRSVTLKATSPVGNQVSVRAVSLPAFASFTPAGNTGVLHLSPQSGNIGDYRIEFAADDSGDPPLSEALVVSVSVLPATGS